MRAFYSRIGGIMAEDADVLLAETMNNLAELRCVLDGISHLEKPIWVSMDGSLRDSETMEPTPTIAAEIAALVLRMRVERGMDIRLLSFNCAPPSALTAALSAIPPELRHQLRSAGIELGAYGNLQANFDARTSRKDFSVEAQSRAHAAAAAGNAKPRVYRDESISASGYAANCAAWYGLGCRLIGGCCGSTPADIAAIGSSGSGAHQALRCAELRGAGGAPLLRGTNRR